ncbi:c-type cytochrome [Psychrobacter sp. TAE2020]|uniref:c-type cytochrome n=1 Tax=Psychrobacter sp. TAE2020 TaxID=2846762 RepID=UPI001E3A4D87|nr:c-type cytochrome [Psychrobacter sp. TAE2020]
MSKAVSKLGSKNPLSTALLTTLVLALGISISACSSEPEAGAESGEILAVDRVDQAADIARQLAPEAEDMKFPATAPVVVAEATPAAGDMAVAADGAAAAPAAAVTEDLAVNVGAELYNKQCMACHANGLLNAPKYGDAAAWAPRIAKGKETLYTHAAKGFNQMNAQVNAEVSEEQVHAAVDYMVAAAS